jgi:hypothetical protein
MTTAFASRKRASPDAADSAVTLPDIGSTSNHLTIAPICSKGMFVAAHVIGVESTIDPLLIPAQVYAMASAAVQLEVVTTQAVSR